MDRSISQAVVCQNNFSLACASSDVNRETFASVQNRKEKCAVSTGKLRPRLRESEGADETLLLLKSANVKNEKAVSNFTQPTLSDASHESCGADYEIPGLTAYSENYLERAAYNWVVDSYKKDCAQKSAESNSQEDMHEESAEVSDKEWRRMACTYGTSDLKAEMDEREKQFSQDYKNAMRNGDAKDFLEKSLGTDPYIFVPV